jgi:glucose-1-phosphate thymidylyltransferase
MGPTSQEPAVELVILAAGYATRLYPLTLNRPKPLLLVAGKPMMEHVLESLTRAANISRIYVATNAKFARQFQEWADKYFRSTGRAVTVVNDGSTDDTNKLGAIGDLHLVLTRERIQDDIIVVAADNLFSEPLIGFGKFVRDKNAPVVGVYDVGSLEEIKKYNAIEIDQTGRVTFFEEKPKTPKSTLTAIALYYYPAATLPLIDQYIREGGNPDQPGRLIQWLYPRVPVYTWRVPGLWYDIGSKEALEEANRVFSNRVTSATTTR